MGLEALDFKNQMGAFYGVEQPPSVQANPVPPAPDPNNIVNVNDLQAQPDGAENPVQPGRYNVELMRLMRNVGAGLWSVVKSEDISGVAGNLQGADETVAKLKASARMAETNLAELADCKANVLARALRHYEQVELEYCKADCRVSSRTTDEKVMSDFAKKYPDEARIVKAFKTVITAQSDIADGLRELGGAQNDDGLRYRIDDLILTCDARVSELSTLAFHLVQMAEEAMAGDTGYKALLVGGKSALDLAKGMGGVMHDNYDTVARAVGDLIPLFEGVESSLSQIEQRVSEENPLDLQTVKDALTALEAELEVASGATDNKVLEGMSKRIPEMRKRLDRCYENAVLMTRLEFISRFPDPFKSIRTILAADGTQDYETLKGLISRRDDYVGALENLARVSATPLTDNLESVQAQANARLAAKNACEDFGNFFADSNTGKSASPKVLGKIVDEIGRLIRNHPELKGSPAARLKDRLDKLSWQVETAIGEVGRDRAVRPFHALLFGAEGKFAADLADAFMERVNQIGVTPRKCVVRGEDVAAVMHGDGDLSNLLLAGLHGVDVKWVEGGLKDADVRSSRQLGAGAVNTVQKLEYADPTVPGRTRTVIFKPDYEASVGGAMICLHDFAYDQSKKALNLNLAASVVADGLGCASRLTKTFAMFRKGRLGIGMALAPGQTAAEFVKQNGGPKDRLLKLARSKRPEDKAKYRRTVNDIVRQTVDLQWLDLLAGQGDRHAKNYLIDIDSENGGATVTGIDNDMCMPKYRTGLTKMRLNEIQLRKVRKKLAECVSADPKRYGLATPLTKDRVKAVLDEIVRSNLTRVGDSWEFDFSRPLDKEIVYALKPVIGFQSLAVPKVMSRAMYDRLKAIGTDKDAKQKFFEEISGLVSHSNAEAFRDRLDDLLALVNGGSLTVVPEAGENNPHPWLGGNVLEALRANPHVLSEFALGNASSATAARSMAKKVDQIARRAGSNFVMRELNELLKAL